MEELSFSLTDLLALWGAVVSSVVAGWTVYRDLLQRDRLVVNASIMRTYPGNIDIFSWRFTNKGKHELVVTHLAAMPHRMLKPRWFFNFVNRLRNSQQSLFGFEYLGGHLPLRVGPLNNASAQYVLDRLGAFELSELYAVTADGREWFVSRKDIKSILSNNTFQQAQTRANAEN